MNAPRGPASLRGARGAVALAAVLLALVAGAGCVPSNVVAADDRSVVLQPVQVEWAAADASDLAGMWRSQEITGDLAAALLHVAYWFEPDGRFSGAALTLDAGGPAFHVLVGQWTYADGMLRLGDGSEPATLEGAPGWLRLRGTDGSVVLRKEELR